MRDVREDAEYLCRGESAFCHGKKFTIASIRKLLTFMPAILADLLMLERKSES
jgi:hypothetical protein